MHLHYRLTTLEKYRNLTMCITPIDIQNDVFNNKSFSRSIRSIIEKTIGSIVVVMPDSFSRRSLVSAYTELKEEVAAIIKQIEQIITQIVIISQLE